MAYTEYEIYGFVVELLDLVETYSNYNDLIDEFSIRLKQIIEGSK